MGVQWNMQRLSEFWLAVFSMACNIFTCRLFMVLIVEDELLKLFFFITIFLSVWLPIIFEWHAC